MARVNVDDELDGDPRFKRLVRRVGDEDRAVGMLVRFWRLAQRHWGNECALVPAHEFDLEDFEAILQAGLAERRDSGIYAKGSEERFSWYTQKVRAGKKRAAAKRNENGQFAPNPPAELPKPPAEPASAGVATPLTAASDQRNLFPHQPLALSPAPAPVTSLAPPPVPAPAPVSAMERRAHVDNSEAGRENSRPAPDKPDIPPEILQQNAKLLARREALEKGQPGLTGMGPPE